MIMYVCPKCRKLFKINGTGKKAKCPKCQDTILVDLGIAEEDWKTTGQQEKDNAISAAINAPKQETPEKTAHVRTEPAKIVLAKADVVEKEPVKKAPVMTPVPPKKEPNTSSLFDFGEDDDKTSQSRSSFFDTEPESPKKPPAETPVMQTVSAQTAHVQTAHMQAVPAQSSDTEKQKHSTLSIVAFILSFFGCMSFVGIVLAIVDLVKGKNDDNKHTLSKISLGIAGAMFVLSIVLLIGIAGSGDHAVANNEPEPAVEDVTDMPDTDPEPTETQEDISEENSTGDAIADAALAIGDAVGGLYESYEDIYNEYTVKLKDSYEEQCKVLDELVDSGADAMTISFKCGECIYNLAEVNGEGTNKMAEINVKNPLNYDDYEKWAKKLYGEYEDYGTKLYEEYVGAASDDLAAQLNSYGNSDFGGSSKSEDKEALREAFNSSLGDNKPLWYDNVRNDVTGNWRELVIYSDKTIDKDRAIEYCKAYFESDDEVHFIVNLYLKTTTQLNKYGDTLSVTCKEYKDKEEHDAKELGGGDVLDSFVVNIDTGELME